MFTLFTLFEKHTCFPQKKNSAKLKKKDFKSLNMNTNKAKQIKIQDFLNSIGIQPDRVYGKYYWYKSPLRDENKPSFKVNTSNNFWFDVATNSGGNIIDLVCSIYNCNISTALHKISSTQITSFSFQSSKDFSSNKSVTIKHLQTLQNKALIEYVKSRKIKPIIAEKYISEAYYRIENKNYFALAFKNDKNGYELRNKYFKGSTNPKYITTLKVENSQSVNIFEAFMDFLSALEFFGLTAPTFTTIILNSTSLSGYAIRQIHRYKTVNLFLDNDKSGNETVLTFQKKHPNVKNRALQIYPNHKDFNEFLINSKV